MQTKLVIKNSPYGNSYVEGITAKEDGTLIINGRNCNGDERSITINPDGSLIGGGPNKELGILGYQMFQNLDEIFKNFNRTLPKEIKMEPKLLQSVSSEMPVFGRMTTPVKVERFEPFKFKDNLVESIKKDKEQDMYIIEGKSKSGDLYITIDKNGNIKGKKGVDDLGEIGRQVYDNKKELFDSFGFDISELKVKEPVKVYSKAGPIKIGKGKDNFVDCIKFDNGIYTIEGRSNNPNPQFNFRSITIDKEGNVRGKDGNKDIGWVGWDMYREISDIFTHFGAPKPENIKEPIVILKPQEQISLENGYHVDHIELENGTYTIDGVNGGGEHCSITIDKEGNVRGKNGELDIGVVGRSMYRNVHEITWTFH